MTGGRERRGQMEIGHNQCNQLNKVFLCLGPKKCIWKHLLILQEGECPSVWGGIQDQQPHWGFVMISPNS